MPRDTLSRSKGLKLPKIIKDNGDKINSVNDLFSTKHAFATANNIKFNPDSEHVVTEVCDLELDQVSKIPEESSDLIVITKTKKLGAYIIAITHKTPMKFRSTFINRMQNFCLEALQDLFAANSIRQDCLENKKMREKHQTDAIIKLKMLGYISLLAENAGCILMRQYKQISIQLADAVNLAAAWKKSDDEKWRNKDLDLKGSR